MQCEKNSSVILEKKMFVKKIIYITVKCENKL